jgi:hypothetical protein
MFEPPDVFHLPPGLIWPLSRLNRALFSILIDSASWLVSPSIGKAGFKAASNFIRPNQ